MPKGSDAKTIVLEHLPIDPARGLVSDQLKRQRVYILPTRQGAAYGLLLLLMLLGATNYSNSMAFMFCFLLAGIGTIAILHTYKNLTGLILTAKQPAPVFAQQPALFPIHIDNRFGLSRVAVTIERSTLKIAIMATANKQHDDPSVLSVDIAAGTQQLVYYPCLAAQRGVFYAPALKISTQFPLGLFRAWAYFRPKIYCLVYPLPKGQQKIALTRAGDGSLSSTQRTGTDDFIGFKKYQPGESINLISWKAFAKSRLLLVKQFSGSEGANIIMLQWRAVSNIQSIEDKLSQLCSWILYADKAAICYGLELPDSLIQPGFGEHHKQTCLAALARYGHSDS